MTDDHLSLDELAELDEGLLPPERTSAVRAHLYGCAQCRARAEAITSTRSLLADLPPVPMPAGVKARLDRVIAEEADQTAEEADHAADAGPRSTTVVPNVVTIPRHRFGRPTMAASAAAAAVVLAIGAIVVAAYHHPAGSVESGGPAQAGAQAPAALRPATTSFPTNSTGRTYTLASLPAEVSSLLAVRSTGLAATSTGAPSPLPSSPPSDKSIKGGKPSTFGTAGAGPKRLLAAVLPSSLQPLFSSPQKLLSCAEFVTPTAGALPIAVDFGRWSAPPFHHAPSVIFVFADSPSTVRVVVVGPSCAGNAVRKYTEVPLPN